MMMKLYPSFILFVGLVLSNSVWGEWNNPKQILTGSWGHEADQFGLIENEMNSEFPRALVIDKNGNIIVGDSVNKRIKIYNSAGSLITIFGPKMDASPDFWPPEKMSCYGDRIFVEWGKRYQFYDYQGNIVAQFKLKNTRFEKLLDNGEVILYSLTDKLYKKYAPDGQLLQTYTDKPLELGIVDSEESVDVAPRFKIKIKYSDQSITLSSEHEFFRYARDADGTFYGINSDGISRFTRCGKVMASLLLPINQKDRFEIPNSGGRYVVMKAIYGEPVLAPNGDVYAWKRTDLTYSIVKWKWINKPQVTNDPCKEKAKVLR